MKSARTSRALASISAGLAALTLAGCTIGPVTLPDVDLGFLGNFGIVTTSVADAEQAIKDQQASGVDSSELVEPGTLTVGLLSTNTAPLLVTRSDGSSAGVGVEFAYAVADHMGLSVKFVTVASATAQLGTDVDVVVGVSTADAASATGVTVLGDYAETAIGIFGRGSSASASDLSGKTVGVQPGSVSQRTLTDANLGCSEQGYASINEAMEALGAGSVDYVVCDAYSGSYLASDYDGVQLLGTLDAPVAVGVSVSTDKSTLVSSLASAVEAVQGNGQLDVIKSRWCNGISTLTSASMLQGLGSAPAAEANAAPAEAASTD